MAKKLIFLLITKPAALKLLFKSLVLTLLLFLIWFLNFQWWFLTAVLIFLIVFYLSSGKALKKIRFSFWLLIFLALIVLALPSTLSFADRSILLIDRSAPHPSVSGGIKTFFEFQNDWLIPVGLKLFLIFVFFILFFLFLKSIAGEFNFFIYSASQFVLLILIALTWFYLVSFAVSNCAAALFFLSFFLFLSVFLIFNEAFLNVGGFGGSEVAALLPPLLCSKSESSLLQGKWRLRIAALAVGLVSLESAWFLTLLPLSFFNTAGLLVLTFFLLREGLIAYFKNKFRLKFAVFLLTFFIFFILVIFITSQWSV